MICPAPGCAKEFPPLDTLDPTGFRRCAEGHVGVVKPDGAAVLTWQFLDPDDVDRCLVFPVGSRTAPLPSHAASITGAVPQLWAWGEWLVVHGDETFRLSSATGVKQALAHANWKGGAGAPSTAFAADGKRFLYLPRTSGVGVLRGLSSNLTWFAFTTPASGCPTPPARFEVAKAPLAAFTTFDGRSLRTWEGKHRWEMQAPSGAGLQLDVAVEAGDGDDVVLVLVNGKIVAGARSAKVLRPPVRVGRSLYWLGEGANAAEHGLWRWSVRGC